MISNTVIVFLRDLLPIFILFSYLSVLSFPFKRNINFVSMCFLLGATLTILFYTFIEKIGESLDGTGLEVFNVTLLLLTYFTLVVATILPVRSSVKQITRILAITGVSAFIAFKSSQFLLYFGVYGRNVDSLYTIVMGCILGLGICISFSALLRFLLTEIYSSSARFVCYVFWFAFLAGHLNHSISYLSQVDMLSLGPEIINLDFLIQDSSEYGHVLHALVGYESSPSFTFLMSYAVSLVIPLAAFFCLREKPTDTNLMGGNS